MIFYKIICTHFFFLSRYAITAGSKEHQTTGRRKNLNCSEELVEDDRGDELVMDTTLKIGFKNIKGDLNCSSSSNNHGWMSTMTMDRSRNWPAKSPSHIS
jgi:hypothetical protein